MKAFSLLLILGMSFTASAAEIYQITDEKGRKVFTNIIPPDGNQAEKVTISDTNLSHDASHHDDNDRYYEELAQEEAQHLEISQHLKHDQQQAHDAVKAAEANLAAAKEIRAGDYFNIPGKGLRYTEAYHQRIRDAQMHLDSANDHLRQVQGRRPAQAPRESIDTTEEFDSNLPR